mmetsp:Transcript_21817/g.33314  ORF Transcript_21817/g.33314 Transcript_21817/m.33314 type:complete len:562 (-) Transcript_21817:16-1701(-)
MIGMYMLGMKQGKSDVLDDKGTKQHKNKDKHKNYGTSFTLERVQNTRQAALNLITMLQEYYGGKEQSEKMMLQSWLQPWDFDNATDMTGMVDKMVDTMARALVTDDQKEFIIGTIGSSVAAGHDNCNYDSYELQMERTFGPVWEAAGMKLTCQNAGEGGGCGDDFANQVFCIQQNVSPDIDIAHYTWTYYEAGGPASAKALVMRESLARWAQMLPHQPPVHVYNTGKMNQYQGDEHQLAEHMSEFGYNAFYMTSGLYNGGFDYDAAKEDGVDHLGWGHVGDGYHNVTRYGENESSPERKESLGTVMRNWHPGPLAFQFVSDTFSYIYSQAILRALDLIESDLKNGIDPAEKWAASKRKIQIKSSLPPPIFCDPLYCVVDEAPGCLNFEKPTYGWWGARVEDPDDSLNPHKGEVQNWEVWHVDEPIWRGVSKQDQIFFEDRDDKELCRHLDTCGGISATSKESGSVVFRLPKQEVGLVVICGCCGKKVGTEMILNNTNIEISYNGEVLDRNTWDIWPRGKCVRLMKKFDANVAKATTGHNYLKIEALENLSSPVRISHVITL